MSIHDETWDRPICPHCKKKIKYGEQQFHIECEMKYCSKFNKKMESLTKPIIDKLIEAEQDKIFLESLCPELDKYKISAIIKYYQLK